MSGALKRQSDALFVMTDAPLAKSLRAAATGHEGDAAQLHHYWTKGEGLAKWAESPHPFAALKAHLAEFIHDETELNATTAQWVHDGTGHWPVHHKALGSLEKVGPHGFSHGWKRDGAAATIAHTQHEIEALYGQHDYNNEFGRGAYVELSTTGIVHIDLADSEKDKYHVAGAMDKAAATRLVDNIGDMLDAYDSYDDDGDRIVRGHDPVTGLADWQISDGIMVGYTPDGDIRIGFPSQEPGQLNVLDLTNEQAISLRMYVDAMVG